MKTTAKFKQHIKSGRYRDYVGKSGIYDMKGAWQFMLMCLLGLRDHHLLLEIGCGSLRAGRLFIPYLKPCRYYGLEPEAKIVDISLSAELGDDILGVKLPNFAYNSNFDLSKFRNVQFDFILAHSLIMHLPMSDVAKMLGSAADRLAPTGLLVASYVEGNVRSGKQRITYPHTAWYPRAKIKKAVNDAGLLYAPLLINERHPKVRWFVAFHPKHKPIILGDSALMMINRYWQWERHGRK